MGTLDEQNIDLDQNVMVAASPWEKQAIQRIREKADEGEGYATPRWLLSLGGWERRGSWVVSSIKRLLDAAGVVTEPSFEEIHIDGDLRLIHIKDSARPLRPKDIDIVPDVDEDQTIVGLRVGSVRSATTKPVGVHAEEPLRVAMTRMASEHFSQLPMYKGSPEQVVGYLTWETIALSGKGPDSPSEQAVSREPAPLVGLDTELLSVVPVVIEHNFVLVHAQDSPAVIGIVTMSDLVETLATLANPFFLIGDIERRLRQLAEKYVPFSQAGIVPRYPVRDESGNKRNAHSYDDLGFNELATVFRDRWSEIGWPLDQPLFSEGLDEVRSVRNEVMHFRPDPPSEGTLRKLRHIARWLRQLD